MTKRRLRRYLRLTKAVHEFQTPLRHLSDEQLRSERLSLSFQAKSVGISGGLLPRSFALVREAARRSLNIEHYDVQLIGGCVIADGYIAEMATGEGKTLTATLPLFLYSLFERGTHIVTANDYLAERDANWVQPIFELLGMKVRFIVQSSDERERGLAYQADVTYGTLREFAFDFLRAQLKHTNKGAQASTQTVQQGGAAQSVQRTPLDTPFFLLVDEADSLLVDEAGTPLIISLPSEQNPIYSEECFSWANAVASDLNQSVDYELEVKARTVHFSQTGSHRLRELLRTGKLRDFTFQQAEEAVRRALIVREFFRRDEHYLIVDNEIQLIDEFTGRITVGRKLREGVHQAIEEFEGQPLTKVQEPAARMTVNNFTSRYVHLAGMTGTGQEVATDLKKHYDCRVVPIPTFRPCLREELPILIFLSLQEKHRAIEEEVRTMITAGRPVLIGTRTIQHSQALSDALKKSGIEHALLNGVQDEDEADIISKSGQYGRVTVATNMAGRGTDIHLPDEVREVGGLHVIGTEFHESARIDRQLAGRVARQGDPGSFRQMASFDDSVLVEAWGESVAEKLKNDARDGFRMNYAAYLFRQAQRDLERRQSRQLLLMLESEKRRCTQSIEMGRDPWLANLD